MDDNDCIMIFFSQYLYLIYYLWDKKIIYLYFIYRVSSIYINNNYSNIIYHPNMCPNMCVCEGGV
jgi:hypothetical protein